MARGKAYPALDRPPIVEVVCGVVFEPIAELDPLVLGVYWDERKEAFPQRAIQPAIMDDATLSFGLSVAAFPMRAALSSHDQQFVLQLQQDRMYLNWRATGAQYPRFSDRDGRQGLLAKMLLELDRFSAFVKARYGAGIVPVKAELSKIDMLLRGQHWTDIADMESLLPVTKTFADVHASEDREVNLRFVERAGEAVAIVQVVTLHSERIPAAVRLEARRIAPVTSDVRDCLVSANDVVNDIFFKLIPEAEQRFSNIGGAG